MIKIMKGREYAFDTARLSMVSTVGDRTGSFSGSEGLTTGYCMAIKMAHNWNRHLPSIQPAIQPAGLS